MGRIRKTDAVRGAASKAVIWRIALYIRLSRDDGNDESLSVTNQRKILREYVVGFFEGAYAIIDEYIDDGRSGTDYDRPAFQRMIHDVETKKVNCVICKNLARAFRNYSDQGFFLESFFPLHGTRFITLGDPKIDTYLNPEAVSGMEVPINGLMNDRFAAQTSNSVRRTFDHKRRSGEFIGAFAPYGYAKNPADKNALVIDEEAAGVVRDIFQWYVYGDGCGAESLSKEGIARKLNEMGVPNPTRYKVKQGLRYKNPHAKHNDGLWMGSSVSRILQNKVYIGTMVQGRQRVISYKVHQAVRTPEEEWFEVGDTHDAIIPRELFEKAGALQKSDTRTAPGKRAPYLFSGLLRCADCGKAMTRRASAGHVYYNCSTYKRKSKDRCTKHTLRLDGLERTVLAVIRQQIQLIEHREELVRRIQDAPVAQTKQSRLSGLLLLREGELRKTEDLISGLYLDWKNGDITREQHRKMKERFEKQEAELREAIRHLRAEMDSAGQGSAPGDMYLAAFLARGNVGGLSQGMLVELIEAIRVHEGGMITIQFACDDPYRQVSVLPSGRGCQAAEGAG